MKKILIIGGDNGGGSAGDEIMCQSAYEYFLKQGYSVYTDAQSEQWKPYSEDVKVIKQLRKDDYSNIFQRIITSILKLYRLLFLPTFVKIKQRIPLLCHGNDFKALLNEVDVIFFAGNGGLTDKYPITVLTYWSICNAAKKINVPVYISGVGIGPLTSSFLRRIFKAFVMIPEYISVRENGSSMMILKNAGREQNVLCVPDDAYFYEVSSYIKKQAIEYVNTNSRENKIKVGINIMKRIFETDTTFEYFNKVICLLFPKDRYDVYFIAVTQEDSIVLSMLQKNFGSSILVDNREPSFIKALIGQMDFMISSRYHGCVFAVSQNIPVIGIFQEEYWKDKINGVLRFVDLQRCAISIKEVCSELEKLFKELEMNKECIKSQMKRKNAQHEKLAYYVHKKVLSYESIMD